MGFRFRKSIKVLPGVRVNLSHRGVGTRIGPKGLGFTSGPSGKRINASLPGTGLSYSKKVGGRRHPQTEGGDRNVRFGRYCRPASSVAAQHSCKLVEQWNDDIDLATVCPDHQTDQLKDPNH